MEWSVGTLLISSLIDIALCQNLLFKWRHLLAGLWFWSVVVITGWLVYAAGDRLWVDLLAVIALYRLFNLYRLTNSLMQFDHLKHVSAWTAFKLWLLQLVVVVIGLLLTNFIALQIQRWLVLAVLQFIVAALLLGSTLRHQKVTKKIYSSTPLNDANLPTLTVAIPARNETDDLYECLLSILSSNYPKLEVLVLDDNSTIRRTPEIIRSFAHDGVEFVAGEPVPVGWLAKNWAYEQLLNVANGEIVLFCGADSRFDQESLRFLVSTLTNRGKSMISILPKNRLPNKVIGSLLQPLRYAWEISLPRRFLQRPPVLSTCWAARKDFLQNSGGFKAITRRIVCESYFARQAAVKDGYSFFQYDGVISRKMATDQLETALRLRYPQLHRQPELVSLITIIEVFIIFGSIGVFVGALLVGAWPEALFSGLATALYSGTFYLVRSLTYRQSLLSGLYLWPLACLIDIYLLQLSMWRYEFGTVLWKGRSVTSSVMYRKTA